MVILVLGGSGSGKSAFAEYLAEKQLDGARKYYIATMEAYGEEGRKKVERHKRLRAGKGFLTIEQSRNLSRILPEIKNRDSICLLECLSNLVANEMFQDGTSGQAHTVAGRIKKELEEAFGYFRHSILVSGNVFEDGAVYAPPTQEYIQALGCLNKEIAKLADAVIEVVYSIPVILKGEGVLGCL